MAKSYTKLIVFWCFVLRKSLEVFCSSRGEILIWGRHPGSGTVFRNCFPHSGFFFFLKKKHLYMRTTRIRERTILRHRKASSLGIFHSVPTIWGLKGGSSCLRSRRCHFSPMKNSWFITSDALLSEEPSLFVQSFSRNWRQIKAVIMDYIHR